MPKTNATPTEQGQALGHLLYEMLILAAALVFRNRRHHFSKFQGLQWGIPQIAQDVIRLKYRLLIDFFELRCRTPHRDEIVVTDFTSIRREPVSLSDAAILVRVSIQTVNQGTAHLSWKRLTQNLPTDADRREMDDAARVLLQHAVGFVERGLANGLNLDAVATTRWSHVKRLNDLLRLEDPIDERTVARRPTDRCINPETLSWPQQ